MKKLFKGLLYLLAIAPMLLLLVSYWAINKDPLESKYAPLIAYGFPYIVLLNIATIIVLLLIKKWKIGVVNLVMLLAGYSYISRIYAFGSADNTEEDAIKILSYNVRLFDRGRYFEIPREQIRDSIFAFIENQDADIVCFQEFYCMENRKKFVRFDDIFRITGTKHFAGSENMKEGKTRFAGSYIFSKYPIVNHGFIEFNAALKNDGRCAFADIQISESRTIRVYNFHLASISFENTEYDFVESLNDELPLNESGKANGLRIVRRFVDASKRRSSELKLVLEHATQSPYPTILCGDLNDTPSSYAYNQLKKKYNDAFLQAGRGLGRTYAGKMPANRIDYIFHDNNFKTNDFFIQNEVLSDHKAIQARLTFLEDSK